MLDNPDYVRREYATPDNLDARIYLHQHYTIGAPNWYRWLFDHLALPEDARVLDVGCGPAQLWRENSARLPAGWRVVLADLSPGMIAAAGQGLAGQPGFTRFCRADIQALPFADASFDAILANHMLYHVPDRPRAYTGLRRALRPGGRLFAATNSRFTMRSYDELIARFSKPRAASTPPAARRAANHFTLENGQAELAPFFARVTLHPHNSALLIPEAGPLVAYAAASSHLAGPALERLRAYVEGLIAAHGPLLIEKKAGLFEAEV